MYFSILAIAVISLIGSSRAQSDLISISCKDRGDGTFTYVYNDCISTSIKGDCSVPKNPGDNFGVRFNGPTADCAAIQGSQWSTATTVGGSQSVTFTTLSGTLGSCAPPVAGLSCDALIQ